MDAIKLQITSAIAIDGEIAKRGELVEVTKAEARNLLDRGKAVLVGDDGNPLADDLSDDDDGEGDDAGDDAGTASPAPAARSRKRRGA